MGVLSLSDLERLLPDLSRRSLQRDLKRLLDRPLIQPAGSEALTDPNRSYRPARLRPGKQ